MFELDRPYAMSNKKIRDESHFNMNEMQRLSTVHRRKSQQVAQVARLSIKLRDEASLNDAEITKFMALLNQQEESTNEEQ